MSIENEFVRNHLKSLDSRIETLEQFILGGPSSDVSSDEVAMEYLRNIGKLESLKEAKDLFESHLRAYFHDPK